MKSRRGVYIIVGAILIATNLLADLIELGKDRPGGSVNYSIGYFIGSNFLLLFGIMLLRMAYKIKLKIAKSEDREQVAKSIDQIGSKV